MRRSKKLVLIVLLGIVVLAGSLGSVAIAQTDGEESQPRPRNGAFLEKVCDIYNENTDPDINCEALKAAFAAAHEQMRSEFLQNRPEIDPEAMKAAMLKRIESLHDEGKINDEQYAQKKEWIESMPDNAPIKFGFRGHGGFRGFHRFGGPCALQTTE